MDNIKDDLNEEYLEKLKNGDHSAIFYFENVMEDVVTDLYPHLLDINGDFLDNGAEVTLISGSGASIFGIFVDDETYNLAYENLKDKYDFVKKVELI